MIFFTLWIVYVSFALCIFCHSNMADMHIKNKAIFYISGISFFNRKVFEGKKSSLLVLSFFPKVDTEILLWNALNIWAQWLAHTFKKFHSCEHGSKCKKINDTLTQSCVGFLIFFFLSWTENRSFDNCKVFFLQWKEYMGAPYISRKNSHQKLGKSLLQIERDSKTITML